MMFYKNSQSWRLPNRCYIGAVASVLALMALFALVLWLFSIPPITYADNKIAPNLQAALAETIPDQPIRFIVHLQAAADFRRTSLPVDKEARRTFVVEQLQDTATVSQASLISQLDSWQDNGHIHSYRPFWIINAIAIVGTPDIVDLIAARPEVERVALDESFELIQPPAVPDPSLVPMTQTRQAALSNSWGLDRVRAPASWYGLGIDGSGVTVAIMDTGVDWLHPDLFPNYRGNLGNGQSQHPGNWYHAAIPTYTTPIDLWGHGTHVAGTAVGQNGIGVAPGAQWIAVAIADEQGFIFESYAHAGFEWLIAPNGNPNLAPDVVNGSWGGPGNSSVFVEDIEALQAAGILSVFAAGNSGPAPGSIGAPGSYTDTIAIGASDSRDEVAWFSSRGPSQLTSEIHPHLIAPGTTILSAFPNNQYAIGVGTSMAAPHATGAAALLLSANPSLTIEQVKQALLTTAVPVTPPHPNNDSGWGRLDAYAAVGQEAAAGTLYGTVQSQGLPLPGIHLTLTTPGGAQLPFVTDENGQYEAQLQPGTYALTVNTFGFGPYNVTGLTINHVTHTLVHHVNLTALPAGTVIGSVRATENAAALTATIRVEGTPITVETDSSGYYTLTLPAGQYELVIQALGRRLGQITLSFVAGQTQNHTFYLVPGPAILLVDSSQWYYNSQIRYYQDSLEALDYSYQLWEVHNPFTGAPTYDDLHIYDTVIWNAPEDAPGLVSAGAAITQYLKTGGHFFVSGQNVASYDGFGFGTQLWWHRDLEARYIEPAATETFMLTGTTGTLFEGLTISLNGSDSAQNQVEPDVSEVAVQSLTEPSFQYGDGRIGGLQRSHCKPFHLVYLGFGLEGVTGAANREAILERSFDYFNSPPVDRGLRWLTADIDDYAPTGTHLVYTVTVENLSETMTDTFQFQIEDAQWAASLITTSVSVAPCQTGQTVFTVEVPPNLPQNAVHSMHVTAVSTNDPALTAQLHVRHKIPGQILFVDDDRWYHRQDALLNSLDQMGLTYDIWETGWPPLPRRGSPPAALLQAYEFIIWYTGYDWFQPVTDEENEALHDYLTQGGRLFLTSQDYLYYHQHQPLVRDFFGLLTYQESMTPTQVYAGNQPIIPIELAGPIPLNYTPYLNNSDGILPTNINQVILWGDQGMGVGLNHAGLTETEKDWRLVFFSIPFEVITTTARTPAMTGIMGWLGDLGDSTFVTENRVVAPGTPQTYTLTLKNLLSAPTNQVMITNTLPLGLDILPETLAGGAIYNATTRQLTWQGTLTHGAIHIIRYQAIPTSGQQLDNRVTIYYERHGLAHNQTATVWVNTPDLSQSQLTAVSNTPSTHPLVTYTLRLQNDGLTVTNGISAVVRLPDTLTPLTHTLHVPQGNGFLADQRIHWQGDLIPGQAISLSLQMTGTTAAETTALSATAVVHDGITHPQIFHHLLTLRPFTFHLPFIAKE